MIQTDQTLLEYTDWKSRQRWADAVRHFPYRIDGASVEPLTYLITKHNFFVLSTAFFLIFNSSVSYDVSMLAGDLCAALQIRNTIRQALFIPHTSTFLERP